ncbi:S8 family peptidase [Streptomyces canus]|uniref:S8 family peptidase n=1 Tax=Streptomyces canus TaxID=58343 RepID=UPI0033B8EAC1
MRNKHRLHRRGRPVAYGAAALLAVGGLTATAVTVLATPSQAEQPPSRLAGAVTRVTLITGDTVGVDRVGHVVGVAHGKGRTDIPMSVRQYAGHTYVVPLDAASLLGRGRLDRRLFDVTQLIADGYDDTHRTTLPLIVSYKGTATDDAKAALRSADAEVERQLPAVHGQALTTSKPDTAEVWKALTRPTGTGDAVTAEHGVDRVWLDAKVQAPRAQDQTPDPTQGTARIGAPTAWKAGYDGTGVKVAVLDTGIDATHPDLKGAVVGSKNFAGSGSVDDTDGHGTHVAATIAGSGADSGGRYKGVAPGAKLLIGQVFSEDGTTSDSTLIAAMQWATAQGAKVVNMSLGATDTEGVDPMEKAVNDLSASTGALFVIAAGNEGPAAGTTDSPATAAAALSVAAVDSKDSLADFSSRGPDADGNLKPDISAPGVDIISAKAAHGIEGDPVATAGYVSLSGTSMATPHVAGSAAVLAEEHPDWSGQRIKAALMASAVPLNGTSSPYEQGTGRVDVARAVQQTIVADTPSFSLGTQSWPHTDDKPEQRTLTYRNTGDQPVTLDLAATATGPGGKPAPAGMFTLSATRLTVPAGGTATDILTADTRAGSTDGLFGGTVVATTATGQSVRTTFGVTREAESYNLTLKAVGRNGKPTVPDLSNLVALDSDRQWAPYDSSGGGDSQGADTTVTLRVPRGRYLVDALFQRETDTSEEATQLVAPGLVVDKDTTVTLDARAAKPVHITAPDKRATLADGQLSFGARGAKTAHDYYNSLQAIDLYDHVYLGQIGPATGAKDFIAQIGGVWQHGDTGPVYNLVATRKGSFFTGLTRTYTTRGLARLVTPVGSNSPGSSVQTTATAITPGWPNLVVGGSTADDRPVPSASIVQYMSTENGLRWSLVAAVGTDDLPLMDQFAMLRSRRFEPGRGYRETFNTGVFGPITGNGTHYGQVGAAHSGTNYTLCLPMFADATGHDNVSDAAVHMRLTSGHTTITDLRYDPCYGDTQNGLLKHRATYRLSIDATRTPAKDFTYGNSVSAVWTFTTDYVADTNVARLPLSVVRFMPRLSLSGAAKAGTRLTVPVGLQGPAAAKGAVKSLTVKVSYDGGHTWKKAPVHTGANGKRHVTLTQPTKPGKVSLKATLVDRQGNTVTQTHLNAYRTVR